MTTMTNTGNDIMTLCEWIPMDKLDWELLSSNPKSIPILEKNVDKVDWTYLSFNPNAIPILEKNLDKVDWQRLSSNPNAIHILEKNLDKVDWFWLSTNPNAICILEKNLDKVDWSNLSLNPNIFEYDYEAMKNRMYKKNGIAEDLMKNRFHPMNMTLWNGWGLDNGFDDE
jgi:hypothetical protein